MRSIDYKKVVGHKISIARTEMRLNQTGFGDLLGVGQAEIAKLESGRNNTTTETIQWIAEKTKKQPAWFYEPMPGVDYSPDAEGTTKKSSTARRGTKQGAP